MTWHLHLKKLQEGRAIDGAWDDERDRLETCVSLQQNFWTYSTRTTAKLIISAFPPQPTEEDSSSTDHNIAANNDTNNNDQYATGVAGNSNSILSDSDDRHSYAFAFKLRQTSYLVYFVKTFWILIEIYVFLEWKLWVWFVERKLQSLKTKHSSQTKIQENGSWVRNDSLNSTHWLASTFSNQQRNC